MHRSRVSRRSLLRSGAALACALAAAGCGGEDRQDAAVREADPNEKAKESMDYYKKNVLNKKPAGK